MQIKTSNLTGIRLDWAVAECEEYDTFMEHWRLNTMFTKRQWSPSTDWSQGGPIIDEFDIDVLRDGELFAARTGRMTHHPVRKYLTWNCERGPTKLIAAMRCYVASKLGEEIDVPDELITANP